MKKLFIILILSPFFAWTQNALFSTGPANITPATKDPNMTMGIIVNELTEKKIIRDRPDEFQIELPFFGGFINFKLQKFSITNDDLQIISKTNSGDVIVNIKPTILSYKIMHDNNSIGVMNFFDGTINATFKINNKQYEIINFNNTYFLFEASNSINNSGFSCQVMDSYNNFNTNPQSISTSGVCIDLALEVDNYTRQTFSNNTQAVNWALAIFTGVSQLYEAQTNASINVVYTYIWNTTDPYASYVNSASNMLSAFRNYWISNNGSVNRDIAHLLTKRTNTGTGGIAYVDVLCNNSYGYGFSANLNNVTTYNFPNPSYTWNLACVSHEIGHNVGSNHTHWCGWQADPAYSFPGGTIDDCYSAEGSCTNSPGPEVGSIMSYCHVVSGGSVVLQFDDIVLSQALNPGISNASCLTSCSVDGCTDPQAFNYDPNALNNDGSCCYIAGCTDPTATNYNTNACYDNGTCTFPIYGCTDPLANNYNSLATVDDGSCCYNSVLTIDITTDNYPTETAWQVIDELGNVYANISAGDLTSANSSYSWDVCLDDLSCYSFVISDTYGDGICCSYGNGSYSLSYNGSNIANGGSFTTSETIIDIGSCIPDVVGCMNSLANNYNPLANTNTAFGGIIDPNVGTGAYFTGNQYLILDCNQESRILSAVVYTQSSNTVTFELRNSGGSVIDDTTLVLIAGGQVINLNFDVPIGTDYQLGVSASGSGLYRNNGGVNYPYDIGGLINIKYSSASSDPYGYYYFFYDIEVEAMCTGIITTVYGCTNPNACNYDPNANSDDGSCLTNYGCIDPQAYNYDPNANCDDGSCLPFIYGCTDPNAFNYNASANTDDNSCTYLGCIDPQACNYDLTANIDDGSCIYADSSFISVTTCDSYFWNGVNYTVSGIYSTVINNGLNCDSIAVLDLTINYFNTSNTSITACDLFNWNGNVYTSSGYYTAGPFLNSVGCDSVAILNLTILQSGCTDPLAINYDSIASCDDGTCIYNNVCNNASITGLYVSEIIDKQVVVNFNNMNTYDANGTQTCRVDQIRIKYRKVGTSAWSQKNIASPIGYDPITGICNSTQKTDKPIRNLTPATTYEWQVKIWYCNGGNGGWTIGPNFTTAGECPNIGNLTVYSSNNTGTRATFDWDDSNGSYEFTRIKMRIDSISNPIGSDWFLVGGSGISYGTFTKNKNGLIPGMTYRAQARTWCNPNGGAYKSLSWTPLVTWTQDLPGNRLLVGKEISNLNIYPNPSKNIFNISFTSESIQDLKVRIFNVIGEELISDDLQQFIGEYTKQINLEDNAKGIYFLEIETNDSVVNKKLILQ